MLDGLETLFSQNHISTCNAILRALNNRKYMHFVTLKQDYNLLKEQEKKAQEEKGLGLCFECMWHGKHINCHLLLKVGHLIWTIESFTKYHNIIYQICCMDCCFPNTYRIWQSVCYIKKRTVYVHVFMRISVYN